MKPNKIKLLLPLTILLFCLTGCGEVAPITVNVENNESLATNTLGTFTYIGNYIYYDSATKIVYRSNYVYSGNSVYVPYYAPNGLPYRYNPETNTFEEIGE